MREKSIDCNGDQQNSGFRKRENIESSYFKDNSYNKGRDNYDKNKYFSDDSNSRDNYFKFKTPENIEIGQNIITKMS